MAAHAAAAPCKRNAAALARPRSSHRSPGRRATRARAAGAGCGRTAGMDPAMTGMTNATARMIHFMRATMAGSCPSMPSAAFSSTMSRKTAVDAAGSTYTGSATVRSTNQYAPPSTSEGTWHGAAPRQAPRARAAARAGAAAPGGAAARTGAEAAQGPWRGLRRPSPAPGAMPAGSDAHGCHCSATGTPQRGRAQPGARRARQASRAAGTSP